MDPRKFALTFGISALILGLLALHPALSGPLDGLPALNLPVSYGRFLNLFPMNIMNKGALITLGALGLVAAYAKFNALPRSINYARAVCYFTLAQAVLGLLPQTNTLFGYWPLFGTANVATSLIIAAVSGAYGHYLSAKVPDSGPAVRDFTNPAT